MKKSTTLALTLLLAACGAAPTAGPLTLPLQERLRNPLVAERYWSELAEHMANFVRTKDPILKDVIKAATIDAERTRALERVAQARALKNEGMSGRFQSTMLSESVDGEALLKDTVLYFGTTFVCDPNPSIHVFLTTMVDPRDAHFPDKTSLDLGELQTAYGPQEYAFPETRINPKFRTAVLYDMRLERLLGFAQLAK